jgi:hypothetical protein
MATRVRRDPTGQVRFEVCVARPGDVAGSVLLRSGRRIAEVEATVDHRPAGIGEMGRQLGRLDERRVLNRFRSV